MEPKIAIIGAGISGLATGYRLHRAGIPALVLEKESEPGGRTRSDSVGDFVIDRGAYTLPESHKTTLRTIRELGLEKELREVTSDAAIFHRGEAHAVQIGSPADFFKYKLLSLKNKKDLIKIFLYAVSLGKALNLDDPPAKTFELERESASEYLLREYDRTLLETIAYPLFCERFLGTPENNSKAALLSTVKILGKSKIFSLRQGMGSLARALGRGLPVRFASPVQKVRPAAGGRGPYRLEIGGAEPQARTFERVVFALPLPLVPGLFEDFREPLKKSLGEIRYAPSLVYVLGLDRSGPPAAFINSTLRDEFQTVSTVIFDGRKNAQRHPEGQDLITVILGEEASRRLLPAPEHVVAAEVQRELNRLFPGLTENILFSRLYRWEHAAVQLRPGTLAGQRKIRQELREAYPHLSFPGDGLSHSSIEVQMNAGFQAAEEIIAAQGA